MAGRTKQTLRKEPRILSITRDAVIKASGPATCVEAMRPHYDMVQKLARAWGSNTIAVMLFIGEDWLRGRKNWFPIAVEKTKFAPGHRLYLMFFHPQSRILCDFSIDFCFGGAVEYDPDLQEGFLQEILADPSLEARLAVGMQNFGLQVPVQTLRDVFVEAFHESPKYAPEKLFATPPNNT